MRSRIEAETVVELVYSLLIRGVSPEEIGVVVPYRAQSRLVRSLARRIIGDEEILRKLVIDTVERMQGQEREVVLVSFATASPKFAAQVADFLFQPQRLNVAVTRPRTKLILVGSHHLLDADQYDAGPGRCREDAARAVRRLPASDGAVWKIDTEHENESCHAEGALLHDRSISFATG